MTPLFMKGRKKPLKIGDIYKVLDADRSQTLGDKLENSWEAEMNRCKSEKMQSEPSLLRVLVQVFGLKYLLLGFLVGVEELFVQ
jgi:hypothetical protein